jgi:hypothetical protein
MRHLYIVPVAGQNVTNHFFFWEHYMKHILNILTIIAISAITLGVIGLTPPAMSCELNQAVIRAVWNEDATEPVAKSVGSLGNIGVGDRFAVVQYFNGSWALVLVPQGVPAQAKDVVQLTPGVTHLRSGDRKMTVVKMLTSTSQADQTASCVADEASVAALN